MASTLAIRRKSVTKKVGFFPDQVVAETQAFTELTARTDANVRAFHLVRGNLAQVTQCVNAAIHDYTEFRRRHPEHTGRVLEINMPTLQNLGYTWYPDYSGSALALPRDTIMLGFTDGQLRSMERNSSCGWAGILRPSPVPFSQMAYAHKRLREAMALAITQNQAFGQAHPQYLWTLLNAQGRRLEERLDLAEAELRMGYTDERFAKYRQARSALKDMVEVVELATMMNTLIGTPGDRWATIPFPMVDKETAKELWKENFIADLLWDAYDAFSEPYEPVTLPITMLRGAQLTSPKMLIDIATRPVLDRSAVPWRSQMTNADLPLEFHQLRYEQPEAHPVTFFPLLGNAVGPNQELRGIGIQAGSWLGNQNKSIGWTAIGKLGSKTPEFAGRLTIDPLALDATPGTYATLAAAIGDWKGPTLLPPSGAIAAGGQPFAGIDASVLGGQAGAQALPLTRPQVPLLVLPEIMMKVTVNPLYTEGADLIPDTDGAEVEGYATQRHTYFQPGGGQGATTFWPTPPPDFRSVPVAGRTDRPGVISELFGR